MTVAESGVLAVPVQNIGSGPALRVVASIERLDEHGERYTGAIEQQTPGKVAGLGKDQTVPMLKGGIGDVRLSRCSGPAVPRTAGVAERREAGCGAKLVLRCGWCGELLVLRSVALAFGWHPFRFSSGLRASRSYGQVLRSADIKADSCDGRGDLHGRASSSRSSVCTSRLKAWG
jgi:hypothetical protein